jgi:hypothetical protein
VAAKSNGSSGERSRVRFMLVDFDGSSSDVQLLAQTFANAVKAPQQIVMNAPPAIGNGSISANPALAGNPAVADVVVTPDQVEATSEARLAPSKPQNGSRRKLKTPSVISGLEFTSGAKSLKDYIQEQSPDGHSKRYLAVMQWLKEHRTIGEVGADHIYTCYRALGLTVPDDVLSVLRSLKKQAWVEAGTARGTFRITHIGEGQLSPALKT